MSQPDFSGIDPLRVPEARRRIAALDAYLALPTPTERDIRRLADGIGVSRTAFFRLARVWRDHRDARLLVIGKRGRSKRDGGLDPRAVEIMRGVIAETGPDDRTVAIADEVRRRCADAGVKPPSSQTIVDHTRRARAAAGVASGPPRVAIGRMWFHLPIKGGPANAMPVLLCAVALPERVIVAHRISTDPAQPPSVDELIDALAAMRTPGAAPRPLIAESDDLRAGAAALERAGLGETRSHRRSVQRDISQSMHGRLGPLSAIYQRGMARPETKPVLSGQDEPLPAEEIAAIIAGAVDSHNAAKLAALPAFDLEAS